MIRKVVITVALLSVLFVSIVAAKSAPSTTATVTVRTSTNSLTSNGVPFRFSALCLTGEHATGGGYDTSDKADGDSLGLQVDSSYPNGTTDTRWDVTGVSNDDGDVNPFTVFVICQKDTP